MRRYIFMLAIQLKMIHNKKRKMKRLLQRLLLVDSLFSLVDNKFCLRLVLYLLPLYWDCRFPNFPSIPCFSFSFKFSFNFRFSFSFSFSVPVLFSNPLFVIQSFHSLADNFKRHSIIEQNF